jgi:Transposase
MNPRPPLTVDMPDSKITFKKAKNGTVYVYRTIRAYRNDKGNPTSDEVSIGKKDPSTGRLIPNDNYYDYYEDCSVSPQIPQSIYDYGNITALLRSAENCGLLTVLRSAFPDKYKSLLVCAVYMLCESNVMMYIGDIFQSAYFPFENTMDSRRSSELSASLSYDERMNFFSEWSALMSDNEYFVYDVTSISTYARNIEIAERGYNRDREYLDQLNLGMYYAQRSNLPVYYNLYNGSITDKSHFVFILENIKQLKLNNLSFVLDRGFVSEKNLEYMDNHEYRYIVPFALSRVQAKEIIASAGENLRSSENYISECELYAKHMSSELYGRETNVHIYFDAAKCSEDEKHMYAHIERLKTELEKLNRSKKISRKYTDYFIIEKEKSEKLEYSIDHEKTDEHLKSAGYMIFISNDSTLSSKDVIEIYRRRDMIEKNFDQLKNELDFKRLRTHVNKTTEGKVFTGFVALILRSYITEKIKSSELRAYSIQKILIELRKIKRIVLSDGNIVYTPLSKLQKQILEALDIAADDFCTDR